MRVLLLGLVACADLPAVSETTSEIGISHRDDPPEAEWIHDDGIYAWAPIDDWTAYAGRGKRGAFHCIQ